MAEHRGLAEDEEEPGGGRKARGRPRLTDTDRARRRLESRKKYDVRRVYLGEAHGPWVQLRRKSGWSDAKLAAYLISLEKQQREAHRGQPWEQIPKKSKRRKRRKRNVNCVKNLVIWYEDHRNRCPFEPLLSELDPTFGLYTTAIWQCEAGHRYFQDLHSPLKPLSDSESDRVQGIGAGSSRSSEESSSSESEEPPHSETHQVQCLEEHASADLLDPEGLHLPSEQQLESLSSGQDSRVRQEPPEGMETVVCVPVQVSSGHGSLFDGMNQETLGEMVASCPMQGMVQGSQVIIIAGPGYEALTAEGIHLNVTSTGGDTVPCSVIEGVTEYTQMDPDSTIVPADEQTGRTEDSETSAGRKEPYVLRKEAKEEEGLAALATSPSLELAQEEMFEEPDGPEAATESLEPAMDECETPQMSAIVYEIPKETGKRRSRRGQVADIDGMLEMFHCPYEGCSQVYVALSSFQNHVNLVHRKGKTKVCPHPGCGKKFYLSNHLRRHMIIHSGVREFICETCGKSFKRKNHLEVHRRTHTGETPLQCEICGYQCRQRASLNWHMKKHVTEVQYNFTCEHCGKPFEKLDSVKFHKLKSHPDPKPP
ncbi:zinc finger protein 653 [Microcaecilia unicolor]|uniref:Zinc finger protein 653 n=1 Tax=Microcaecilia unicolor TaxID=1415580 RepID=A0A6P7XD27_9AMPH|nr:zinc finger protein 653 [Microcaecilia unicolor]